MDTRIVPQELRVNDPNVTDHLEVAASDLDPRPDRGTGPAAQPDADAASDAPADDARRVTDARPTEGADTTDDPGAETVDLEALAEADPRSKAELLGALLLVESDRDEYLDDLRRARAEFDNYRRRVTREAASQRRAGVAEAATAMLEVLDDLDRTLEAAAGSSDEQLAKGVELVASKLTGALRGLGVQRVDETGVPFDPNLHEAVQQVPREADPDAGADHEPTVVQVFRPGYRLDDRVLRAAMVVVEG